MKEKKKKDRFAKKRSRLRCPEMHYTKNWQSVGSVNQSAESMDVSSSSVVDY